MAPAVAVPSAAAERERTGPSDATGGRVRAGGGGGRGARCVALDVGISGAAGLGALVVWEHAGAWASGVAGRVGSGVSAFDDALDGLVCLDGDSEDGDDYAGEWSAVWVRGSEFRRLVHGWRIHPAASGINVCVLGSDAGVEGSEGFNYAGVWVGEWGLYAGVEGSEGFNYAGVLVGEWGLFAGVLGGFYYCGLILLLAVLCLSCPRSHARARVKSVKKQ